MAYISFRRIDLLPEQTVSAWFVTNASIVNQDTRYTFYDSTGNIVSEYIGTKPVITSTELTKSMVESVLTGTINSHTHTNASQSTSGLMSASDKTKLDGIASGATANTGTVTSVDVSAGTGISVTGSPITSSGSITVTNTAPNANHTGDVTGATALTISNNVVTNAKLANMAVNRIKGRVTAGSGAPEDLTPAQVRSIINVEDGANKYIHPSYTSRTSGLYKITVDGTGHVNTVTAVAKSDITALGIPGQDTTYQVFSTTVNGLVPKTTTSNTTDYLRRDGTWATPPNTTYGVATTSTNGLMSSTDKTRLDNVYQAGTSLSLGTVTATTQQVTLNKANSGTASTITLPQATISLAGLMSSADKTKLDGIAQNANNYVHPTPTRTNTTGTATPAFGGTFSVIESITSSTEGHVTGVKTTTVTIPTPSYPTVNNGTLTLNVSGLGLSGSASFSANQAGNAIFTVASNATANNTASTIVSRDANKDFSANIITTKSVKIGDGEVEMLYDSISDTVRFVWN